VTLVEQSCLIFRCKWVCADLWCVSCCSLCHFTHLHIFGSVLWCPLRFPCSNDVRVVFTLTCFVGVHISFMFMFICSYSRLLLSNTISISDDVTVTNQSHTRWVQLVKDESIEKVLSSLNDVGVTQSLTFIVEFVFLP